MDRSAAYAARRAKNIVAAGLASKCALRAGVLRHRRSAPDERDGHHGAPANVRRRVVRAGRTKHFDLRP